jgi:DNA-binding CsgD family transcriptional regulator
MATGRSKLSKAFRKFELEKLICSTPLGSASLGPAEMAKRIGVTARTVRSYLAERREELCGPPKVWLHLYSDDQHTQRIEEAALLTLDECARRLNISVRQLRRQIWEERRDRIARVRAEWKK